MGPTGLTAVFGMGTGVTPPVWSPGIRPEGGQAPATATLAAAGHGQNSKFRGAWRSFVPEAADPLGSSPGFRHRLLGGEYTPVGSGRRAGRRTDRGGQAIGCWDRSAAAVARRALPAHRPGRLPGAFAANAAGNLVLEGASRLDAFSAYPVPTWLPGDAPSGTAGTPEVGPPQSSRTRGDAPQVSYAHGR